MTAAYRHAASCRNLTGNRLRRYLVQAIWTLLLTALSTAHAQPAFPASVAVKRYTRDELKTQGIVMRVKFDHKKRLWIGTSDGLVMMDGTYTSIFRTKDGLFDDFISDIETAPDGTVYVSTKRGISRFTENLAHPFKLLPMGGDTMSFITAILPLGGDTILMGDLQYTGLHTLVNGKVDNPYLNVGVDGLVTDICRDDRTGRIYFSEAARIFWGRPGRAWDSAAIRPLPIGWSLLDAPGNGTVWCSAAGLYRFSAAKATADTMALPFANTPTPANMRQLPDGRLLATGRSLQLLEGNSWRTVLPDSVVNGLIHCIAVQGSTCWLGGEFGLLQVSLGYGGGEVPQMSWYEFTAASGQHMAVVDPQLKSPAGVGAASIYRDRKGQLWYLISHGVYRYAGGALRSFYTHLAGTPGDVSFLTAHEDASGRLWFGTSKKIARVVGDKPLLYTDPAIATQVLRIASPGQDIWFAGTTALQRVDVIGDSVRPQAISQSLYNDMATDRGQQVWVATNTTIQRLGTGRNHIGAVQDTLPAISLKGERVLPKAICFDARNNLWMAGDGVLAVFLRQDRPPYYTPGKRLVFTAGDLPVLPVSDRRIVLFPAPGDSLLLAGYGSACHLSAAGLIAAAMAEGPPVLHLADIAVAGAAPDWQALGYVVTGGFPGNPVFNDSTQELSFRVSPGMVANAGYMTYEYRLAGHGDSWKSNGLSPMVTLNGLAAGYYTLGIRAVDASGRISNVVSYSFRILPPWYLRWWAIALWGVLIAAVVAAAFMLRIRAVKRKGRLERIVLENQLKALRAQINPHFLQNTFDFVSDMLDDQPVNETKKIIRKLSAYLRNVLDRTDESVVTLENELDAAEEYLSINQLLFPGRFRYSIDIDDQVDPVGPVVPSLLLQPSLENALKHGTGSGDNSIALTVRLEPPYIVIRISNDISPATGNRYREGYKPVGLQNTTQRLLLAYGKAKHKPVLQTDIVPAKPPGQHYVVTIKLPE